MTLVRNFIADTHRLFPGKVDSISPGMEDRRWVISITLNGDKSLHRFICYFSKDFNDVNMEEFSEVDIDLLRSLDIKMPSITCQHIIFSNGSTSEIKNLGNAITTDDMFKKIKARMDNA